MGLQGDGFNPMRYMSCHVQPESLEAGMSWAWGRGGRGIKSEMHKLNQKCLFGVSLIANVNWMLPFTTFSFSSNALATFAACLPA